MLIAGRFYLPFYVCAVCTAFIGLILRIIRNIIMTEVAEPEQNKETAETITESE